MKKKNVISPLFTQPRKSIEIPAPPSWIDSCACHTAA